MYFSLCVWNAERTRMLSLNITAPVSAVFGTLAILAVSRGFQDLPKLKKLTEFYTSLARHPSSQQPSAADNFSPFKIREIKQKRLTIVFNGN